jgi:hypothetical protein
MCRRSTSNSLDVLVADLKVSVSESRKSLSGRTSLVIIAEFMLKVETGSVLNRKIGCCVVADRQGDGRAR